MELDSTKVAGMRARLLGKRVRLVRLRYADPSKLSSGAEGIVVYIDYGGTVHVVWDNGSKLGLLPEDRYEVLT